MESFNFQDVALKDGMLKDVLNEMIAFYRSISLDSMFKYLRADAGLPAPGEAFTGWYLNGRGQANICQWQSAMCRIYAITGEERDRERAVAMMEEFWKLHDLLLDTPQPVFTATSFYNLEKALMALIDYKEYVGIDLRERAAFLVDFALHQLETRRMFGDNCTEWYTVGESFYRAAEVLELPDAKAVAKKFEYRQFWDLFHDHKDPFSRRPQAGLYSDFCHAYSHVNSFNSCAMAYRETGDPYYLDALKAFYEFLRDEELMCTGGYGAEFEHLMPKEDLVRALRRGHDSFETQCDTYAAYRVVRQLTELTRGSEYSDWSERLLYNATAATIPMTPEGKVLYYSDYNMNDAFKQNRQDNWTCCTGTRPLLVCEMARLLYFHDDDGLYVAQYAPSTLRWNWQGKPVTVEQDTAFPVGDETRLTLHMQEDAEFSLFLRKPGWLKEDMAITVNGHTVFTHQDAQGWLRITRSWGDGDVLCVTLPQPLWMDALDKKHNAPNAFLRGPVVLAAAYDHGRQPIPPVEVRTFLDKLRPVEGTPLHYDVEGHPDIHFKPFYEFKELEHYSLYFDTGVHATETVPIY